MLKSIDIEFKVFGMTVSIKKNDADKINKYTADAVNKVVLDALRAEKR